MSDTKVTGIVVTGGSTAASLSVTGSPVFAIVVAGVAVGACKAGSQVSSRRPGMRRSTA
jgi:hypothetical protein